MLVLNNLKKTYNSGTQSEQEVLRGISVTFPGKGLVALHGRSGCGKTTLLNLIGGLTAADDGSILFDGAPVSGDPERFRAGTVGFIYQDYCLKESLTVGENVADSLRLLGFREHAFIRKRTEEVLRAVGMEYFTRRKAGSLSGGQKQRVAIARAIAGAPRLLLADEPTGNLDSENTHLVMGILKAVSRSCLVLLVTHEDELVSEYCDFVYELPDGKELRVPGEGFPENEGEESTGQPEGLPENAAGTAPAQPGGYRGNAEEQSTGQSGRLSGKREELSFGSVTLHGNPPEKRLHLHIAVENGRILLFAPEHELAVAEGLPELTVTENTGAGEAGAGNASLWTAEMMQPENTGVREEGVGERSVMPSDRKKSEEIGTRGERAGNAAVKASEIMQPANIGARGEALEIPLPEFSPLPQNDGKRIGSPVTFADALRAGLKDLVRPGRGLRRAAIGLGLSFFLLLTAFAVYGSGIGRLLSAKEQNSARMFYAAAESKEQAEELMRFAEENRYGIDYVSFNTWTYGQDETYAFRLPAYRSAQIGDWENVSAVYVRGVVLPETLASGLSLTAGTRSLTGDGVLISTALADRLIGEKAYSCLTDYSDLVGFLLEGRQDFRILGVVAGTESAIYIQENAAAAETLDPSEEELWSSGADTIYVKLHSSDPALTESFAAEYFAGSTFSCITPSVLSGQVRDEVLREYTGSVFLCLVLAVAVAVLLLAAVRANTFAGLPELAVDRAMGVRKSNLTRKKITENVIFVLGSGGVGILLASCVIGLLSRSLRYRLETPLYFPVMLPVAAAVGMLLLTGLMTGFCLRKILRKEPAELLRLR